jgi:hypothetical protein
MGVKLSTEKTVSEAAAAVRANHFGVMRVHNLNRNPTSHRKTTIFRAKPGMTVSLAIRKEG